MASKLVSFDPEHKLPMHASMPRHSNLLLTGYRWLRAFGLDLKITGLAVRELSRFISQARAYRKLKPGDRIRLRPHLHDRLDEAGSCTGHYFWQDLIVAREIRKNIPTRHIDVGSRVDGLITHLLVFRDVEVVDIRQLSSNVKGLSFIQDDAMVLSKLASGSVESLSSLHALEHFGLGRYGDPIDPDGHLKGMRSLERVLAPRGRLWLSFPVGEPVVEFNGQRVIHPETPLREMLSLRLVKFTGIPADGAPVEGLAPTDLVGTSGWCGLYEFQAPDDLVRFSERAT